MSSFTSVLDKFTIDLSIPLIIILSKSLIPTEEITKDNDGPKSFEKLAFLLLISCFLSSSKTPELNKATFHHRFTLIIVACFLPASKCSQ